MQIKLAQCEQSSMEVNDFQGIVDYLNSDIVDHTSYEEIDAYEKALKKKGYSIVGSDDDPYMLKQFKNGYFEFTHDKKGKESSKNKQI